MYDVTSRAGRVSVPRRLYGVRGAVREVSQWWLVRTLRRQVKYFMVARVQSESWMQLVIARVRPVCLFRPFPFGLVQFLGPLGPKGLGFVWGSVRFRSSWLWCVAQILLPGWKLLSVHSSREQGLGFFLWDARWNHDPIPRLSGRRVRKYLGGKYPQLRKSTTTGSYSHLPVYGRRHPLVRC